jgi:choline dehydrogenase-like flavoprotein
MLRGSPGPGGAPHAPQRDSETVTEHYDVVIVGTGAGGGTLERTLAPSGKRILLLERGDFLPREMDVWDPRPVFVDQAGTCRFGTDPATSLLDVNCKAHELDNLYVVDTSFFPSIGAVNPALTAMANAIRVGEHLLSRMA